MTMLDRASEPPDRLLSVMTWNIDGWHTIRDAQVNLLDTMGGELALLQEVTPKSADVLRDAGWEIVTALDQLSPTHREREDRRPRFSCGVAARGRLSLIGAHVIADAPSPSRTLVARVESPGGAFTAISAALPPGSMWGRTGKQAQARAIEAQLLATNDPALVGMDRNGPKYERFEPAGTEWWPEDDPSVFAHDALHGLRDVLRTHYDEHPELRARAHAERPDGPLAIPYMEQRTTPPTPRRYDVILASPEWEVIGVTYDYAASVAAGSDHSFVCARVQPWWG